MELAILLASCVSGKGLAGGAADQNLRVLYWKEARDLNAGKPGNVFFNKQALIVLLVRIPAFGVYVHSCIDGDAFS
jgi:hypothetical protein